MKVLRECAILFILFTITYFPRLIHAEDDAPNVEEEIKPKTVFTPPIKPTNAYLVEYFTSPSDLTGKLIISQARKDGIDEALAKYDGEWLIEVPHTSAIDGDYGLVLKSKAKHHAISMELHKPIKFDTEELVIQYEVKFQEKMDCGGAYIKLLSASPKPNLKEFNDKTPYTIMFGPDKCGLDSKYHFIFRHKHPKTGVYEEKHAKKVVPDLEQYFTDAKTHLYTLVLRSDNSFERYIDQVKVQSGSLLEDFEPAVNPPVEIDDPTDKKPIDWDDVEKIPDKDATKPDDWDETQPEFVLDESATKPSGWLEDEPDMIPDSSDERPSDWDDEMDGEWSARTMKNPKCADAPGCGKWEPPMIRNSKYKGKWSAPLITNPAYKGVWKPKKISNPDYFEDKHPYKSLTEVSAVGLELWSMTNEIVFDNFIIVDSKQAADEYAEQTWRIKRKAEKLADPKAQSVVDAVKEAFNDKPWLMLIIGLVCTLPIVLCCVYFCRSPKIDEAAIRKKTDQPVPSSPERTSPSADSTNRVRYAEMSSGDSASDEEEDLVQVPKSGSADEESDERKSRGEESSAPEDADARTKEDTEKQSQQQQGSGARRRRSRRE